MKREELNIMSNIKMIEKLKANLLCIIGEFYHLLTKRKQCGTGCNFKLYIRAILILYVLAQKLGYSCEDVDADMKRKLKTGIAEGMNMKRMEKFK